MGLEKTRYSVVAVKDDMGTHAETEQRLRRERDGQLIQRNEWFSEILERNCFSEVLQQ